LEFGNWNLVIVILVIDGWNEAMLKFKGTYNLTKIAMGFLDQAKDMYKLQKQAKQIKKQLKNIHIEAEHDGVTVICNGEQYFIECKVAEAVAGDPKRLGKAFVEAANKAVKKSQTIGAEKMKDVMGGFGGMFGKE
jgi:DNA-binding protein YbaB